MVSGSSLFDNEASFSKDINNLIGYLEQERNDVTFLCIDHHGEHFSDTNRLELAVSEKSDLDQLLSRQPEAGTPVSSGKSHALYLKPFKTTLYFQSTATTCRPKDICQIISLLTNLFILRDERNKILKKQEIQRKQFDRKFLVLDTKYQEMLEETQHSYKIIQEQQENYSKTLKTEIELQTKELRKSKLAAEAASIAKSQFLASMSHEIRTPMNGIIGFTEMLLASELDEEQQESAAIIKRSGEALLGLINDILDFSKVEAGQMTLEYIDFDPEITAHDVCEMIRPRVVGKPIEVLCKIGEDVPANVKGDPGRFRQVLVNLLGNSAKFTEQGELELSIDVDHETEDSIALHCRIRDTGIGIPEEKLESIFEAFKQADGTTTRKYGGTGLGLSICRKMSSLMSGHVWVESILGEGTTFHFTAVMKKSTRQPELLRPGKNLGGKRVLVVDDNRANNEILRSVLEHAGMQVETLTDETKTIDRLLDSNAARPRYDLAIIDIIMPQINGYDLAALIRKHEKDIGKIPLLAYTSTTEKIAAKCRDAGFSAYLTKPTRRSILYKTISKILGGDKATSSKTEKKNLVTQYSVREELKQSVRLLLAEDNLVNQKLVTMMLKKAGYTVQVVGNGKRAVEIFTSTPDTFDTILMDVQMPEMDGLEATRQIRAAGHTIPIIAMTANAMKGDKEKCLEAGMSDYMSKPIKRETVFKILEKWLYQ